MKRLLTIALCLTFSVASAAAQELTGLVKIGPVVNVTRDVNSATLNCDDGSQVRLTLLAPDLVRVRTSFRIPIPTRDHSWAIARESWSTPHWTLSESPDSITIATEELEVV